MSWEPWERWKCALASDEVRGLSGLHPCQKVLPTCGLMTIPQTEKPWFDPDTSFCVRNQPHVTITQNIVSSTMECHCVYWICVNYYWIWVNY